MPYHNATINMAEKFKSFYINHVPRQQNAHADALAYLVASLALPAKATEKVLVYAMTCTVQGSPLKIIKLQSEAFKSNKFFKPQQVRNLGIGYWPKGH